jgi:hypothetical protein
MGPLMWTLSFQTLSPHSCPCHYHRSKMVMNTDWDRNSMSWGNMHSRGPTFCHFEVGVGFAWEFLEIGVLNVFHMVPHCSQWLFILFSSCSQVSNVFPIQHTLSHILHTKFHSCNPIQNSRKEKTTINYDHSCLLWWAGQSKTPISK